MRTRVAILSVLLVGLLTGGCALFGGHDEKKGIDANEPYKGAFTPLMQQAEAALKLKWHWKYGKVSQSKPEGQVSGYWYKTIDSTDGRVKALAWCPDSSHLTIVTGPNNEPNKEWQHTLRHEQGHMVLFHNGMPAAQHHQRLKQVGIYVKTPIGCPICDPTP